MSLQHRNAQSSDSRAPYQSLPQTDSDDTQTNLRSSLELDNEENLAEELVSQEAQSSGDARVRWIHFILGCAVLLPWNGESLACGRTSLI